MPGESNMTVKRFVAPDMRRALDLVRQEMGPDAIILSSQRTREGVEIITSTDIDVVVRGGEERKDFGRRFDEELDQPLISDTAWQEQNSVAEAARKYAAPSVTDEGKRREQLAREIEAARERMLAAKRSEQSTPSAKSTKQSIPPVTDTIRWQDTAAAKKTSRANARDESSSMRTRQSQNRYAEA